MKTRLFAVALVAVLGLSGCMSGGECVVSARTLQQPASFTPALFDHNGKVIIPTEAQKVGHFSFSWTNWSMFLRTLPLNDPQRDLSDQLNKEITARGGNAITNMTVQASADAHSVVLSGAIIIPGYVHVTVEGDVVNVPEL